MNTKTRHMSMAMVAAAALALAGCSAADGPAPLPQEATELLAAHGIVASDVVSLVEDLDATALTDRAQGLMASVRSDQLLLSDAAHPEPVALPIPDDVFYLSFAPYVNITHDCYFHSLTTCVGELGGATVDVVITAADGEVLVNKTSTVLDNGFVGVWLPRGIEGTLHVTYGDMSVDVPIATGDEDPTCLTTVQLA